MWIVVRGAHITGKASFAKAMRAGPQMKTALPVKEAPFCFAVG